MTDLMNILLPPDQIRMKIGLFFGSFNPIHIGHLAIANYMVEFTEIDQLWFVVSPRNPLKEEEELLKDYDRLDLVRRAVEKDYRFRVTDVEFRMPKPSYTVDTLERLKEKFPDHTFYIIMGADNLEIFPRWKDYDKILARYRILVYPRPGSNGTAISHENIQMVDAPRMEISSTFIRESVKAGKNMQYFVPAPVWETMDNLNYYRRK